MSFQTYVVNAESNDIKSLETELVEKESRYEESEALKFYDNILTTKQRFETEERLKQMYENYSKDERYLELKSKEELTEDEENELVEFDKILMTIDVELVSYLIINSETVEELLNKFADTFTEEEILDIERIFELKTLLPQLRKEEEIKLLSEEKVITFLPTTNGVFTSLFGMRTNPFSSEGLEFHTGVDIAGYGSIVTVLSGRVTYAGWMDGYGNVVIVNHGNINGKELSTLYAHLKTVNVSNGQDIKKGDGVGIMGTTGRSTGVHLHFEIRENGVAVDPMNYLRGIKDFREPNHKLLNGVDYTPINTVKTVTQTIEKKQPIDEVPKAVEEKVVGTVKESISLATTTQNTVQETTQETFKETVIETVKETIKETDVESMIEIKVETEKEVAEELEKGE